MTDEELVMKIHDLQAECRRLPEGNIVHRIKRIKEKLARLHKFAEEHDEQISKIWHGPDVINRTMTFWRRQLTKEEDMVRDIRAIIQQDREAS